MISGNSGETLRTTTRTTPSKNVPITFRGATVGRNNNVSLRVYVSTVVVFAMMLVGMQLRHLPTKDTTDPTTRMSTIYGGQQQHNIRRTTASSSEGLLPGGRVVTEDATTSRVTRLEDEVRQLRTWVLEQRQQFQDQGHQHDQQLAALATQVHALQQHQRQQGDNTMTSNNGHPEEEEETRPSSSSRSRSTKRRPRTTAAASSSSSVVAPPLVRPLGGGALALVASSASSTTIVDRLQDRLARLETITKGYMNWITDPYVGSKATYRCHKEEEIAEHYICFDEFPTATATANHQTPAQVKEWENEEEEEPNKKDEDADEDAKPDKATCVVYDYGIREQPEFGYHFATQYPHCEVHAFDPSPVSVKWWNTQAEEIGDDSILHKLKALPNYYFHAWGAGGVDGTITLFGYNWGQVSSVRMPFFTSSLCGYGLDKMNRYNETYYSNPKNYHDLQCLSSTDISHLYGARPNDFAYFDEDTQTFDTENYEDTFQLEVKTLQTTMQELGHTHIDVLKLDVEGSEYQFLESAIDAYDCPPVAQMSIEWHHYSFDPRYGGGSSREMNAIVTYLHDRCNVQTYQGEDDGGYCLNKQFAKDAGLRLCYMTTSLITVPPSSASSSTVSDK